MQNVKLDESQLYRLGLLEPIWRPMPISLPPVSGDWSTVAPFLLLSKHPNVEGRPSRNGFSGMASPGALICACCIGSTELRMLHWPGMEARMPNSYCCIRPVSRWTGVWPKATTSPTPLRPSLHPVLPFPLHPPSPEGAHHHVISALPVLYKEELCSL